MNKNILLIMALAVIGLSAACSEAGSIWTKRGKNMPRLYSDDTARQVGDVLTIIVSESSKVDNKIKRDLKKEVDRSTTFNGELGIDHLLPSIPGFTMSAKSNNELKGKADYKDERLITDRVTVVVEDILPNGNLVVLGTRHRDVSSDIQTTQVSGIVRPSDVAFDNTVRSEQVANFRLVTLNKGVSETYNKPGWLGKVFDFIWPF